jgi:hypothetical protein
MEATEKRRKSEQNQDTCWIIRPKRMRNGHVGGSVDLEIGIPLRTALLRLRRSWGIEKARCRRSWCHSL